MRVTKELRARGALAFLFGAAMAFLASCADWPGLRWSKPGEPRPTCVRICEHLYGTRADVCDLDGPTRFHCVVEKDFLDPRKTVQSKVDDYFGTCKRGGEPVDCKTAADLMGLP